MCRIHFKTDLYQFGILLVNDGSTDNSGELCDQLAQRDQRIRVIHKENGGLSDARNRGIEEASSDLIGFIDSDDYIDEDMYETLYHQMLESNADLSMCGHMMFITKFRKSRLQ